MADVSKLKELLEKQNLLAGELAAQTAEFTGDRLLQDSERLQVENESLRKRYAEEKSRADALDAESRELKEKLHNQMYAERSRFLLKSDKKMEAYFGAGLRTGYNGLQTIEQSAKAKFDGYRKALSAETDALRTEFNKKIQGLESEIAKETERVRRQYQTAAGGANREHKANLTALSDKAIDPKAADEALKQSKAERVIGLNLLGKIGAVFIIIAMIVLSQLVYDFFTDAIKCVFLFSAATLILAVALLLNRKKRTVFSITILSLGIALEYTALSISYFTLTVLTMFPALGICAAVTAVAYVIAVKWKSEAVAAFAQIGGYLPIIAVYGDINLLYGAMVYFLILTGLGFMLSSRYKWQILNYIGFGLNIAGVIVVSVSVAIMFYGQPFGLAAAMTLLFIFLSFALYTLLPVLTNCRIKTRFNKPDFILMTLNTTLSLALLYVMFHLYGAEAWTGLLSAVFSACYFALYLFVRKFFKLDVYVRTLFWLTGLTLAALFVPMQFDERWLGFGWTIEAAALVLYGILRDRKNNLAAGSVLAAVAIASFLLFDVILGNRDLYGRNTYLSADTLIYKYAVLTAASIAVLGAAVYKRLLVLGYLTADGRSFRSQNLNAAQGYAAAVYLNAAGFLIFLIFKIFDWSASGSIGAAGNIQYLMLALMVAVLFVFAAVVPKAFKAYSVRLASLAAAATGLAFLLVINSIRLPAFGETGTTAAAVAAGFMSGIITVASVYVFFDLYIKAAGLRRSNSAGVMIAVTLYSLFCFTHVLLVQYRLNFTNVAFSIAYILAAFVCVALGLYRHNTMTRRFALILAAVASAKLFIIDTIALQLLYRIIGYFVFGIILIGMSFLYQMFYKRLAQRTLKETAGAAPEGGVTAEGATDADGADNGVAGANDTPHVAAGEEAVNNEVAAGEEAVNNEAAAGAPEQDNGVKKGKGRKK